MRSEISFFNGGVFRKNLTRFSPAWGIHTAICLLVILNLSASGKPVYAADSLGHSLSIMALTNFAYAMICALLLFGDLCNARLCNALHAMPLRRETWFFTHILSALVFALIPYTAVALCMTFMLRGYAYVAAIWLGGSLLQFLFFFSLGTLCMFLTGSRFAAVVFYILLNFFSVFAAWFITAIYAPLLPGILVDTEWSQLLSPVWYFLGYGDWMEWFDHPGRGLGSSWRYLLVLSAVTPVLLGVSLGLYRRRKLECAGDFVAVRCARPVFLVVYSLAMGVMFQLFDGLFIGNDTVSVFFAVGVAIGWFSGLMLLSRTVRVVRGRSILGLGALTAVMLLSILATWMDPLGLTRWVPRQEEISSVQLSQYGYYHEPIVLSDSESVDDILEFHTHAILDHRERGDLETVLTYRLRSGKEVRRSYRLDADSRAAQLLVPYLSDPHTVLGYEQWDGFVRILYQIRVDWRDDMLFTDEDAVALAEALRADCEAGNMVQVYEFHRDEEGNYCIAVNMDIVAGDRHFEILVFEDCANTMNWLRSRGFLEEYFGK